MKQKEKTKVIHKTEETAVVLPVEMKVRSLGDGEKCLAYFSANLGGAFAVRGLRLMEGKNGPFLNFPSYKAGDGYRDICFPITAQLRQQMTDSAVEAYRQALAQHQAQADPEPETEMAGMQMG